MRNAALAPLAALLVTGCAGTVPEPKTSPADATRAAAAMPAPSHAARARFRTAARMNLPGLEGVIGAHAASLVQRFGAPRLDIREGDARKLQFAGGACVLDVYLYPPREGAEPEADYLDARLPDGRDTDRAGCVAALRQR